MDTIIKYLKNISLNILWKPTPKLKAAMKRKSQAYTNGDRITKKNIMMCVIKLKPPIYYVKNKERISQRKKEWYARRKAERLAMDINLNEKTK